MTGRIGEPFQVLVGEQSCGTILRNYLFLCIVKRLRVCVLESPYSLARPTGGHTRFRAAPPAVPPLDAAIASDAGSDRGSQ